MIEVLTDTELAERLGVKRSTLQKWRKDGVGPPYIAISPKVVRYTGAAINEWLASRAVKPAKANR